MVKVTKTPEKAQEPGPTLPTAHPFRNPLLGLRDDIDRVFENFFTSPFTRRAFELDPFKRMGLVAGSSGDIAPRMDVKEDERSFEITAELPGLAEKDVEVTLSGDMLTVRGEKRQEREEKQADYHLAERSYGAFSRSFRLPETVDPDRIEASFAKGVLKLALPKSEKAGEQRKKIPVKGEK